MKSLWDMGEWYGQRGRELAVHFIECPFCRERGNFSFEHRASKKRSTDGKELHFDTLKCQNCTGYVMAFWSAARSGMIHDSIVFPTPTVVTRAPDEWPQDVGANWVEAHRSLFGENWRAAVMMARSALQAAMRQQGATGKTLKGEIDDLAAKEILPPVMKDWSTEIRELGNDVAHPDPGQRPLSRKDAQDIVEFLDYLLEYLYTLPHRVAQYRARRP
jgi:hypothetical protein